MLPYLLSSFEEQGTQRDEALREEVIIDVDGEDLILLHSVGSCTFGAVPDPLLRIVLHQSDRHRIAVLEVESMVLPAKKGDDDDD